MLASSIDSTSGIAPRADSSANDRPPTRYPTPHQASASVLWSRRQANSSNAPRITVTNTATSANVGM